MAIWWNINTEFFGRALLQNLWTNELCWIERFHDDSYAFTPLNTDDLDLGESGDDSAEEIELNDYDKIKLGLYLEQIYWHDIYQCTPLIIYHV